MQRGMVMKTEIKGWVRINKKINYIPFSEDKKFFDCKIYNNEDHGELIEAYLVLNKPGNITERIDAVIDYCRPHQDFMWAKYITALLLNKKDWID
jgi:hypothetical protein